MAKLEKKILKTLKSHQLEDLDAEDIAMQLKTDDDHVQEALDSLKSQGLIESFLKEGKTFWRPSTDKPDEKPRKADTLNDDESSEKALSTGKLDEEEFLELPNKSNAFEDEVSFEIAARMKKIEDAISNSETISFDISDLSQPPAAPLKPPLQKDDTEIDIDFLPVTPKVQSSAAPASAADQQNLENNKPAHSTIEKSIIEEKRVQLPMVSPAPVPEKPKVSSAPVSEKPIVSPAPVPEKPIVSPARISEKPKQSPLQAPGEAKVAEEIPPALLSSKIAEKESPRQTKYDHKEFLHDADRDESDKPAAQPRRRPSAFPIIGIAVAIVFSVVISAVIALMIASSASKDISGGLGELEKKISEQNAKQDQRIDVLSKKVNIISEKPVPPPPQARPAAAASRAPKPVVKTTRQFAKSWHTRIKKKTKSAPSQEENSTNSPPEEEPSASSTPTESIPPVEQAPSASEASSTVPAATESGASSPPATEP